MKFYIAGQIESAGGNMNWPLFAYVADRLRRLGYEVFSPTEHAEKVLGPLETIQKMEKLELKKARRRLIKEEVAWICDNAEDDLVIFLLPGWERSTGATAERAIAIAIGVEIYEAPLILMREDSGSFELSIGSLDFSPKPA